MTGGLVPWQSLSGGQSCIKAICRAHRSYNVAMMRPPDCSLPAGSNCRSSPRSYTKEHVLCVGPHFVCEVPLLFIPVVWCVTVFTPNSQPAGRGRNLPHNTDIIWHAGTPLHNSSFMPRQVKPSRQQPVLGSDSEETSPQEWLTDDSSSDSNEPRPNTCSRIIKARAVQHATTAKKRRTLRQHHDACCREQPHYCRSTAHPHDYNKDMMLNSIVLMRMRLTEFFVQI